jgi:hypothetical protein
MKSVPAYLLLGEAWVHHIIDAINGEGGLSNVGGHHDLSGAGWSWLKDTRLQHSKDTMHGSQAGDRPVTDEDW